MSTPQPTSPSPSPSPGAESSVPFLPPSAATSPSRTVKWSLLFQAYVWRFLARIGFYLHAISKPSPPAPSFFSSYNTRALHGAKSATLQIAFYCPADYQEQIRRGRRYPVVVNFHGGGFTIGRYSDDARWAAMVVDNVSAIVVGVTYRLAPKYPFPFAVEDGVCALLHLAANAGRFGIDVSKMALSGFSAGGNLAFAIPLRLQAHVRTLKQEQGWTLPRINAIISWYPGVDNRLTRAERRAASIKPSKTLPPILTSLFDASYFPDRQNVASPYASPAAATDEELKTALPGDIALFLCEWDMLLQEGKDFEERLKNLGKRVKSEVIAERQHGFDKHPSPFGLDWKVGVYYRQACQWLVEVYGDNPG